MPRLQVQLALAAGPIAGWADERIRQTGRKGLAGQFGLGVLLGAVWTPCVGPTLGAASVLASQGESLGQVALVMALFAIGTAIPLLTLGSMSREAIVRLRGSLALAGQVGKTVLGTILILAGLLVLSGGDKWIETHLVDLMPEWLLALTTRF